MNLTPLLPLDIDGFSEFPVLFYKIGHPDFHPPLAGTVGFNRSSVKYVPKLYKEFTLSWMSFPTKDLRTSKQVFMITVYAWSASRTRA